MTKNVVSPSPLQYFLLELEMVLLTHNEDIQIGYKNGTTSVPLKHLWHMPVQAEGRESKKDCLGFFFWLSLRITEQVRNLLNKKTLLAIKFEKQSQGALIPLIIDFGQPSGYLNEMK